MTVSIACESCGQKLTAGEKLYGKTVKCPKCSGAVHVPAPAIGNDLSDMLEEEPAPPPENDEVSDATVGRGKKCERCGDELPPDTRYCVVCGHTNSKLEAKVAHTALEFDKREQRLEAMSRPHHWLVRALFFWLR